MRDCPSQREDLEPSIVFMGPYLIQSSGKQSTNGSTLMERSTSFLAGTARRVDGST